MIEFTLVLLAVTSLLWIRWGTVSRWRMGISGALSLALGVRVVALMTATYLFPCFAAQLLADDEPAAATSTEETPKLEVERPAPAKTDSETAAASTSNHKTDPVKTSVAKESESTGDKSTRPPVPIVTNVSYLTSNRPSWLEMGPVEEGELFKIAVRGGPYRTLRDCQADLDKEIKFVVEQFTNEHLRAPHAATFVRFSIKDLRARKVVREQFSEQLDTSVGLMNQVHAQLVFDNQFRKELNSRWAEIVSKSRLTQTGLGTGIVLLFLGTLFSFLKIDTATKGYYTGRLQFGAAATILALVAASVLLMKWIPWM